MMMRRYRVLRSPRISAAFRQVSSADPSTGRPGPLPGLPLSRGASHAHPQRARERQLQLPGRLASPQRRQPRILYLNKAAWLQETFQGDNIRPFIIVLQMKKLRLIIINIFLLVDGVLKGSNCTSRYRRLLKQIESFHPGLLERLREFHHTVMYQYIVDILREAIISYEESNTHTYNYISDSE